MSDYTEDNIFTPEGLDHVIMRPTAYIHSRGIEGLVHQAVEVITNGIDEIALQPDGVGKLTVMLCLDMARHSYQIVVVDNGRGLPIGKMVDAYTKLGTSGKFDTKAYETSGGLFGLGAKVSAGVSVYFRAITHTDNGVAGLQITRGKVVGTMEVSKKPAAQTGVMVAFEPNADIFDAPEIEKFGDEGLAKLQVLLQKYCFFRKLNVELRVYPLGLPTDIWQKPRAAFETIVHTHLAAARVVFSAENFDRQQWLKSFYWDIQRPFALQHTLKDSFTTTISNKERTQQITTVRYEVQFYYVKFDQRGGRFGMLNNIPIDDARSTHLLTVVEALKDQMAGLIKEQAVRKYFLDTYPLPIYLAVDVKCPGAEPSGTTKEAFFSSSFRKNYFPSLVTKLGQSDGGRQFVASLYAELASDIEARYTLATTGVSKVKNTNRLFAELNYPDKFEDCSATDRSNTELFLVEGDSAKSSIGRDVEHQGIYALRGKPFNGVDRLDNMRQSRAEILKNEIYQDIMMVTGINPAKFDLNTLYFKRINITTDADDHGYHISSLVVSNLYVICPEIIESGMVHVVTPPLYGIDYASKRKGVPRVYLRDETALNRWFTDEVYQKKLSIGIKSARVFDKLRELSPGEYRDFITLVLHIGEMITNVANELVLPPLILETITHITAYLHPGQVDVNKIKALIGFDQVTYDAHGHILILTHGREDYIIPLQNVSLRLYDTVLPLLNQIAWDKLQIYITSKENNQYRNHPMTVMQLYEILKRYDDAFEIKRYKGLGGMPPEDLYRTCMDPAHRTVHQITNVGDVTKIFNLMGNDTTYRKRLLRRA